MRPWAVRVASISLFVSAFAVADGPGMLLSTAKPPLPRYDNRPFEQFRSLGDPGALGSAALCGVNARGKPVCFAAATTDLGRPIPDINNASVVATLSTMGAVLATDGSIHVWGATDAPTPPNATWIDLDAGASALGAVSKGGQIYTWDLSGSIGNSFGKTGARRVQLGADWGVAILSDGQLGAFGLGSTTAPEIVPLRGVVQHSALATSTAATPICVALLSDGSIAGVTSSFTRQDSARFSSVSVGSDRLVALTTDGRVVWWTASASGYATTSSNVGGHYDAAIATANGAMAVIVSTDADRNGEPDEVQVRRGGFVDCNGDLVPDLLQASTMLRDPFGDGIPDDLQARTMSCSHGPGGGAAWVSIGAYSSWLWYAVDRVRPGTGAVVRFTCNHGQGCIPSDGLSNCLPLSGLPAKYVIYRDTDNDGDPANAVKLGEWPIMLSPTGYSELTIPATILGNHGDVIFHGIRFEQTTVNIGAVMRGNEVYAIAADPFARSRARGRFRYAACGGLGVAADNLLIRSQAISAEWSTTILPFASLSWNEVGTKDCDANGMIDQWQAQLTGADFDLDNDGAFDACMYDHDSNGIPDPWETAGLAAPDCNHNMRVDYSEPGGFADPRVIGVPGSTTPTILTFTNLPTPASTVRLTFRAVGDFNASDQFALLQAGTNAEIPILDDLLTNDCDFTTRGFLSDVVDIPAATFIATYGHGPFEVRIRTTPAVNPTQCPNGYIRVTLEYTTLEAGGDCDNDGIFDICEMAVSADCNKDGVPDVCELNALSDADGNGSLDACEFDCDRNGQPDVQQIAAAPGLDCNGNGFLDSCELFYGDCDSDGVTDACQIAAGAEDVDEDNQLDTCERARGDLNLDGRVNPTDLALLLSQWGQRSPNFADLNGDGQVAAQDLAILLAHWGYAPG